MDPVTGSLLGGIGGSVLSGLFGRSSAKKSISFQREMATTAHQKEIADLRAAGLNPILSGLGGRGASASGGAMPSTPDFASSALGALRLNTEIKNIESLTDLNVAKKEAIGGAAGVGDRLGRLMDYVGKGTEQFIQNLLNDMEKAKSNITGNSAKQIQSNQSGRRSTPLRIPNIDKPKHWKK